ncbi:hypothetical protein [Demequina activiva]|uniref:Uncharacterized protein n=1 Tax=Demequina activiva TaxID=1582364 RepID=A0A919UFL0_9MICO|nr:hypothetical protein [Demequina activiva]GIG53802.1 hypothetical protein Dac01nite_05540 [Demequina activiva]
MSATALALVGWAVPAAVADQSDSDKNKVEYWEAQYENAVACYKYGDTANNAHGKVSADKKTVTLKPYNANWPGDRWEVLIVKAGSLSSVADPHKVYELPTAGTAYTAPENKAISHWIVCKGATPEPVALCIDGTQVEVPAGDPRIGQYPEFDPSSCGDPVIQPTCESVTAKYPFLYDGHHINIHFKQLDDDGEPFGDTLELSWHYDTNHPDYGDLVHTETFASHPNWLGWTHFRIIFVQAAETDIYPNTDCGQPKEYVCVWNEQTQTSDKVVKTEGNANEPEWYDGIDCGPVEEFCPNLGGVDAQGAPLTAVPEGWSVKENGDCYYIVYDCWLVPTDVTTGAKVLSTQFSTGDDYPLVPQTGPNAFPQTHLGTADSWEELAANDCGYVPPCEEEVWIQIDRYQVDSYLDDDLIERLRVDGIVWVPQRGGPDDGPLYKAHGFIKLVGEDCYDIDESEVVAQCVDGVPVFDWTVDLNDPNGKLPDELNDLTEITITFSKDGFTPWVRTIPIDPNDYPLWTGTADWPGYVEDGSGVPVSWPGWEYIDGVLQNVGNDNYGWTRDGATITIELNPETTITGVTYPTASGDCEPPSDHYCEYGDQGPQPVTYHGIAPDGSIVWVNGLECTPIEICFEGQEGWQPLEIMEATFNPEVDKLWNAEAEFNGGCEEPAEPTLTGSFIGGTCLADAPWLDYSIVVNNPDGLPLEGVEEGEEPMATITFVNPDGDNYTLPDTYPLGTGRILWPGAAVAPAEGLTEADIDPFDAATFVPTDWPGWVQNELGEWLEVTDPQEDFGWTRNGVQILVEVNPETTVTVNYPPATPECAAVPPDEFTVVAGAPPLPEARPAVPVQAVASYAG